MNFVIVFSLDINTEINRGKCARDRGRSTEDLVDQFLRPRLATSRYCSDIPANRARCVQVCRADPETSPAPMLLGNERDCLIIDIPRDQPGKLCDLDSGIAKNDVEDQPVFQEIISFIRGENFFECRIIFRPKEGERRDQRSGADPGNERKFRPVTMLAPAFEQSGAECTICAAA